MKDIFMKYCSAFQYITLIIFAFLPAFIFAQQALFHADWYSICMENGLATYEQIDKKMCEARVPHNVRQEYILTISADFAINYVWIYNSKGVDIFEGVNDYNYQTYLEVGIYHVMLGYSPSKDSHTLFVRDGILVTSDVIEFFSSEDSLYTTEFKLLREDESPLIINTMSLRFFNNILGTGLHLRASNINTTSYFFKYNHIPSYFNSEWAVKGKQLANEDNLYLLNGQLSESLSDTIIRNNPFDFAYADFTYHLPDSINQADEVYIHTYNPSSHRMGKFDPKYQYPFKQRIYQDTSSSIELLSSVFWQGIFSYYIEGARFYTPEIRIQSGYVLGYHYEGRNYTSFLLSETNEVHLGLTPTYWFGMFANDEDTIKIRSPYGRFHFLFLSQTNDLFNHNPIKYNIYSADSLYSQGEFKWWFENGYRLGFNLDDLTISVSKGKYKMVIADDQIEVAKRKGTSQVTASFDLGLADKNPPHLSNFQIKTGNMIANMLDPNKDNTFHFRLEDDVKLDNIEVYYSSFEDTNWVNITFYDNAPLYSSHFPTLTDGYYNLRLKATDASGNYINCVISPAFHVGEVTHLKDNVDNIIVEDFTLFKNYPNPFNSGTNFTFKIPPGTIDQGYIKIYDILGKEVVNLDILNINQGINKYRWDGTDMFKNPLPSGLYIAKLKGGDIVLYKKIILLR
jgi:hypothetical protein